MENKQLNNNDKKLLELIKDSSDSVNSLARKIRISPSNISSRLPKLEKAGFIRVVKQDKKGKKTLIFTNDDEEVKKYTSIILNEIKELGGEISFSDFMQLPKTIKQTKKNLIPIVKAKSILSMHFNPYLQEVRKLTPEGKEFLKKFSKKT